MKQITGKQVVEWSVYAHRRRMDEGIDGPWWDLIPDDQKILAKQWLKENEQSLKSFFGGSLEKI